MEVITGLYNCSATVESSEDDTTSVTIHQKRSGADLGIILGDKGVDQLIEALKRSKKKGI